MGSQTHLSLLTLCQGNIKRFMEGTQCSLAQADECCRQKSQGVQMPKSETQLYPPQ